MGTPLSKLTQPSSSGVVSFFRQSFFQPRGSARIVVKPEHAVVSATDYRLAPGGEAVSSELAVFESGADGMMDQEAVA